MSSFFRPLFHKEWNASLIDATGVTQLLFTSYIFISIIQGAPGEPGTVGPTGAVVSKREIVIFSRRKEIFSLTY